MIETQRLVLRRITLADVDALVELNNDPQVVRFTQPPQPYDRRRARARIESDQREWGECGHRFLALRNDVLSQHAVVAYSTSRGDWDSRTSPGR